MATHPLALPKAFSPDSLDTSAELATILARLRPPTSSSSTSGTASQTPGHVSGGGNGNGSQGTIADGSGAATGAGASSAPGTQVPSHHASASSALSPPGPMVGPPIQLRDLPTATDSLKHKLHHAREQIKTLPDVDRTIAEQEAEMLELQGRIRRQKNVLAQLKSQGQQITASEQEKSRIQKQNEADKMQP